MIWKHGGKVWSKNKGLMHMPMVSSWQPLLAGWPWQQEARQTMRGISPSTPRTMSRSLIVAFSRTCGEVQNGSWVKWQTRSWVAIVLFYLSLSISIQCHWQNNDSETRFSFCFGNLKWTKLINSTLNLLTMMVLIFKMFKEFLLTKWWVFTKTFDSDEIRISFLNLRIHKKMTVMRFVTFSAEWWGNPWSGKKSCFESHEGVEARLWATSKRREIEVLFRPESREKATEKAPRV